MHSLGRRSAVWTMNPAWSGIEPRSRVSDYAIRVAVTRDYVPFALVNELGMVIARSTPTPTPSYP